MKHSREFFTATGEPEDWSAKEKRETYETSDPVERDPETQRRLSLLNTDLIRSIITKEFVSATGLPPEQMNFIPPERVDRRTTNLGRYDPKTNKLFINRERVEEGLRSEEEKLLMTLHTYHHELGHATSRIECFAIDPQDERQTRQTNMGFLEETREELGWGRGMTEG
jgi:hypothetical protein